MVLTLKLLMPAIRDCLGVATDIVNISAEHRFIQAEDKGQIKQNEDTVSCVGTGWTFTEKSCYNRTYNVKLKSVSGLLHTSAEGS
jgi:hypothetical protein